MRSYIVKENYIGPAVRDILPPDRQTNTHRDIILFLYKDINNYKIVILLVYKI